MTRVGDELTNTLTEKQRIVFRKTAKTTRGELLEMEAYYKPGGHYPPEHYHPLQDEHFEVIKGRVQARRNGKEQTFGAGQSFDVPRGMTHTFRNNGDEEASVIWQVRPALKTQQFYETLWGLASDGKTNQDGIPNLLQMAVMLQDYAAEFVLSSPPLVLQRILFGVLGPLGRLCGYRSRYRRYSGQEEDYAPVALPFKRHTVQASVWIDLPPQDVFAYVANYENDAHWRSVVSMTQVPASETRVGTITNEVIDFLGQRYVTTSKITQLEPGRRLIWEATESAFPIAGWRMAEEENGGTRFTEVVSAELKGVSRLFAPIMVRGMRHRMEAEVAVLKHLLERRSSASPSSLQQEAI